MQGFDHHFLADAGFTTNQDRNPSFQNLPRLVGAAPNQWVPMFDIVDGNASQARLRGLGKGYCACGLRGDRVERDRALQQS